MISDDLYYDSIAKYKEHGVEIKTAITGDNFNLVIMMFVQDRDFPNLGEIKDSH